MPKTVRVDTGRRWLAVGRCMDADPRRAGREAARQARVGTNPALLVVFCSGQADPAEVLAGIGLGIGHGCRQTLAVLVVA